VFFSLRPPNSPFYRMVTIVMFSLNLTFSAPANFKYIFILIFNNIMKSKLPVLDSSVINSMYVLLLFVSLRYIYCLIYPGYVGLLYFKYFLYLGECDRLRA